MALWSTANLAKGTYWAAEAAKAAQAANAFPDKPYRPGPWGGGGTELCIMGQGGWESLEREREVIVLGAYTNYVRKNRNVEISGDHLFSCEGDFSVVVKKDVEPGIEETSPDYAGVPWGHEEMVVDNDMNWECNERITMLSGTVNRKWANSVGRMVGMEGTICGGAFARIHAGMAASSGAVASGDVYGGCARTAGARVYLGGLGYRSSDAAIWNLGLYRRSTVFTVEPVLGEPTPNAAKMSKLSKGLKIATAACPVVDIFLGLGGFAVAVGTMIATRLGYKPKPPPVAPRTRTRNAGMTTKTGQQTIV